MSPHHDQRPPVRAPGFFRLSTEAITQHSVPVAVTGLGDAIGLASGAAHTCAIRARGAVVCWGANDRGQLGDGTTTSRSTPAAVNVITDAIEIVSGDNHVCARRGTTGQVVCWGANTSSQLGDRSTTDRTSPVLVNYL